MRYYKKAKAMHIHIIGCGNSIIFPLQYLALNNMIGRITIQSRSTEKVLSCISDLAQSMPQYSEKIGIDKLTNLKPDIVLISVGVPLKPGQTRNDLFDDNIKIVTQYIGDSIPGNPFVFVVTNPVDAITDAIRRTYKITDNRIAGIGGDSDINRIKWAMKDTGLLIESYGQHSEDSVFTYNNRLLDLYPFYSSVKKEISESRKMAVEYAGPPVYCIGNSIIGAINSFLTNDNKTHFLSVYHQRWGTSVTWPSVIKNGKIQTLKRKLPVDVIGRINDLAFQTLDIQRGFEDDAVGF